MKLCFATSPIYLDFGGNFSELHDHVYRLMDSVQYFFSLNEKITGVGPSIP